jgi:multidrug efflux system outer membrane protein
MRSLVLVLLLAGCSMAPKLEQPAVEIPASYKWKVAQPEAAAAPRADWWTVFDDPGLDRLEREAAGANQDLKVALARVAQARALVGVASAERSPQVDVGFGPSRIKEVGRPPRTAWRGLVTASYEVDLFGRISGGIAAARSDYAEVQALYHAAQLALQADVAQTYFSLREADEELALLRDTVALREDSVKLLERRFELGDISELDLARARTELETTRSDAFALERSRAQLEHALAVLLGRPPAAFSLEPAPLAATLPVIPAGLPSALLERRPDIAAASRAMAAANARIGVAKAAFFPVLRLTAQGGYESGELSELFQRSSRTWALGPLLGTVLTLPVVDGGRNQANLERSYAALEESVARYRQQVLVAFSEVEDNLVNVRTLAGQREATRAAVASASRSVAISQSRYRSGATGYLDVIDAQRSLLSVQRLDTQIRGARAISTVALIRALGGGWEAP